MENKSEIVIPDTSRIHRPEDIEIPIEAVRVSLELEADKHEHIVSLGDISRAKEDVIVCPVGDDFNFVDYNQIHRAIAKRYGTEIFTDAHNLAKQEIGKEPTHVIRENPEPLVVGVKIDEEKTIFFVNYYMTFHKGKWPPYSEVSRLCVEKVLEIADRTEGIDSVAFPTMGAGSWGASWEEAVKGTVAGVANYVRTHQQTKIRRTNTILFFKPTKEAAELINQQIKAGLSKLS